MGRNEVWPFIGIAENYTIAYDYDSSGNQTYQGWCQPGLLKTDTGWRIMRSVYNAGGHQTDTVWPNQSTAFDFIWNLRTTYDYGLGPATVYPAFILTSLNTTRWSVTVTTNGNLVTTPQASGPVGAYEPSSIVLQDPNSVFWTVTISNGGNLITTSGGIAAGALASIAITDAASRIWIVTVSITGDLVTT
jgi:hypothetical protein